MRNLISVWFLFVLSSVASAQGTPSMQAQRDAKARFTATFLDRSKPKAERLAAAEGLRYPDEATFAALLAVAADTTQDDEVRLKALSHHRYDDELLEVALKILDDPKDGGELLDAGVVDDVSRRTTFRQPAPVRQRIQRTFRKLLRDTRPSVRLAVYRSLVAMHDTVAVGELDAAMRRNKNVPIPLADAIELLDLDGSAKHIAALRPYLGHRDPAVQAAAVHALALDPKSRKSIVDLVKNPQTAPEVRLRALRGLAREDAGFASYALPLLEDPRESANLRLAAMKTFAGRMNYQPVEPANQVRFARAVEQLAQEPAPPAPRSPESGQMRAEAQKLFVELKQAFPEVRKHYEQR